MTILPKKHKPPSPPSGSAGSGSPSSSVSGSEVEAVVVHGPPSDESGDLQAQGNVVNPFDPQLAAGPSASASPSRWSSSSGSSSPVPNASEKRGEAEALTGAKRRHRGGASGGPPSEGKRHKSNKGVARGAPPVAPSPPLPCSSSNLQENNDNGGGYNSEDEYSHLGLTLTDQEWEEKDRKFERMMKKKGYLIKHMVDDGSCLFRAVADQVYGDQDMHGVVRDHCMDYVERNGDYFSQYITEEIESYVSRKRYHGVHGNHLEIQALSEMYNRPIHIYCYSLEPINIFQTFHKSDQVNVPLRLSYHRLCHYNSLVDPHKATIGVGLGLPGHSPGSADRSLLGQAKKASEESFFEQMMMEDKIKTTDWEATNEAIEEQVARESYLQWLRDNERREAKVSTAAATVTSATATSGELRTHLLSSSGAGSPKACCSKHLSSTSNFSANANRSSPQASCSSAGRDSPKPCSSQQKPASTSTTSTFNETDTFLTGLPTGMFGLQDWNETTVLAQVMAASQQEYFDSLKKQQEEQRNPDDHASS